MELPCGRTQPEAGRIMVQDPMGAEVMRLCVALPGIHRVDRGAEVALETVADFLARRPDCDVRVFGSGGERAGRHYRYTRVPCVPRERFEGWPQLPMFRDE